MFFATFLLTGCGGGAHNPLFNFTSSNITITSYLPNEVASSGGGTITVTGTNFENVQFANGDPGMVSEAGLILVKNGVTLGNGTIASLAQGETQTTTVVNVPALAPGSYDLYLVSNTYPHFPPATLNTLVGTVTVEAPPDVAAVVPNVGPTVGGSTVSIKGVGFTASSIVFFGVPGALTLATNIVVNSQYLITASAPPGAGTVDVRVQTVGGTSAVNSNDRYTYTTLPTVASLTPDSGPLAGGNTVSIAGSGFIGTTAVFFGVAGPLTQATDVVVKSDSLITATAPPGTGTQNVTVRTAKGSSSVSPGDLYTYTASTPMVTGVSPTVATQPFSAPVTITGSGFTGATAVNFVLGSSTVPALNFAVVNDSKITCDAPTTIFGPYNVVVTTPTGTSQVTSADVITFG